MAMETEDGNWDGWSLMELARIVHQVARNDNNKRTVVQHGAVLLLVKILDIGNIEEQREAVRAIWTLSFDKQNKTEMIEKNEWNVIETLKIMSQSSDETVKKISKQALWTIKDQHNTEYAYTLKKKIIPLKMEKDYKADGWLGFIIGAKLFYEFSGKYEYGDKVNELIRAVQEAVEGSTDMLVEVPKHVEKLTMEPILQSELPVMSAPKPKDEQSNVINIVRKWTPSQVEKWLDINNLPKKLLGRLRGKDIAFLRLLANQSHNTFYQTIREQLNIKDIKSMSDFLFALEDINTDMINLHSTSSL
ncbi:Hypothetical predicted protein [Mytilus galloprovincialis]|uniref:Uncharacterized protein n=1 Tax=Mytilus galloprovincialis TaxID=29158 RepID=A0A8B6EHC9_MYTGA|nr:Hypothetical predicted protein [Mytilus galloprovincialis]